MMTKKEKAKLEVFRLQALAGLAIARSILTEEVYPNAKATVADVARVVDWLEFEPNGDPAEDQSELIAALKLSREEAVKLFGADVSVEDVLEVHEVSREDFFADDEDEEDDEE
jgi:hypothetical protein